MRSGLRLWLEAALAHLLILLFAPIAAGLFVPLGILTALLLGPDDPQSSGLVPASGALFGWLLGLPLSWLALWALAWRLWFRPRAPFGQFLMAWLATLVLIALITTAGAILRDFLAA